MPPAFPIRFDRPECAADLASYIGMDAGLLEEVISSKDRSSFYLNHRIPKRGRHRIGEFRDVWEPHDWRLAEAHKAFARRFELFARASDSRFPHVAAFGYVRHRGTLDNASVHCGSNLLLRTDIRDFFPSIGHSLLKRRFVELGMRPKAADGLATFATINDRLALGLNASPMLANLVCTDLDEKMQELARAYDCKYTRYADDIAMSGKRLLPTICELDAILHEFGFQRNRTKTRCTKLGQAHYVTGLSVSDANGPHVPRQMKRRLRQELYYCRKFGARDHIDRHTDQSIQSGINRLHGTVLYVSHIEKRISGRLKSDWEFIQKRDAVRPSYSPILFDSYPNISCFIDETEISFGNQKYLALGLVFTDDAAAMNTTTFATLREHQIEDAFYAGDKTALERRGLHFTDSHPDLRTAYVKALAKLSCRTFVVFGKLKSNEDYQNRYLSLLAHILPRRLMWYDGATIKLIFEQNSKINGSILEAIVKQIYIELQNANNRRPANSPQVTIESKLDQPCFAAPDYFLAIFSRFAQICENTSDKGVRVLQFERLRDKYRLIVDADTGEEFSRRRTFQPWTTPQI